MARDKNLYDIVRPEPDSLLQSARSFGYTIETALADLIDNSITAEASEIAIAYGVEHFNSFVRIEDNGKGMTEKELLNALKMGSFNPLTERHDNDLGRFGLGLKTASFSQCRRLTVKTKTSDGNTFVKCWDLDVVADEKDWVLLRGFADSSSQKNMGEFSLANSGTIILLEKLDRLQETNDGKSEKEHFYRKFENVKKHLGVIFHRFLESEEIKLKVLNESVSPISPFYISDTIPATELAEEQLSIRGHSITIQPYILPHESKLTIDERKQLQIIKGWTEHQGIYLYRNRRLISDGTWLDLDFRKKDSQRLCRIAIDIPNTLDKEWQIDVKKSSAKIPDIIRKRIKEICFASIEKAIKVYTHRGAYIRGKGEKRELVYIWKARQKQGKRSYEINKEHPINELITDYLRENAYIFNDYMKLIGETLPVSLIVGDFSDPTVLMKDFFEDAREDLKAIYKNTIKALVSAGLSEADATEKVNKIECFQNIT